MNKMELLAPVYVPTDIADESSVIQPLIPPSLPSPPLPLPPLPLTLRKNEVTKREEVGWWLEKGRG